MVAVRCMNALLPGGMTRKRAVLPSPVWIGPAVARCVSVSSARSGGLAVDQGMPWVDALSRPAVNVGTSPSYRKTDLPDASWPVT